MQIDSAGWSGEGAFTQVVVDRLSALDTVALVKVEDAPATRSEADYNFIANEIFVTFATRVEREPIKRLGIFPGKRVITEKAMTFEALVKVLEETDGIGPADYADEGMIQYLRTERIIPPYQTRGYKLVELVRIYEAKSRRRNHEERRESSTRRHEERRRHDRLRVLAPLRLCVGHFLRVIELFASSCSPSSAAESRSRYSVVFGCVCRIDAGAEGETGPSTHAFTAFGLPRVRHHRDNFLRLQNLPHRHRDRSSGDVVDRREPAFADLLPAACVVQRDDQIWTFGREIGRGIVEGEMAILTDAHERQIDRTLRQACRRSARATCSGSPSPSSR